MTGLQNDWKRRIMEIVMSGVVIVNTIAMFSKQVNNIIGVISKIII